MDLSMFFSCKMMIAIGLLHLKKTENATIWIIILLEWKQQQKRFPFPLWGSICKEHYVMNWKLSYNVFVCRKETLIYTKKKERERERNWEREIGIHWKVESFVNWKKASILLPPFHYHCCRDQAGSWLPFAYHSGQETLTKCLATHSWGHPAPKGCIWVT